MKDYNESQTKEYFSKKAEEYDLVENQIYWKLSDKLLWDLFCSEVLNKLKEDFKFLDAGGGTGRWSEKILKSYPKAKGVIYDFSGEMLEQAKKKIAKNNFENNLELIKGNLENMKAIGDGQFDLVFNFHNVLGFVNNTENALSEMARITKSGGYLVSVIPNKYHCIFFNLKLGRMEELKNLQMTDTSRFTKDMPSINLFTPRSITALYSKANLTQIKVHGFPITIYPGMQETQINGSSQQISDILEDPNNFDLIYNLEKNLTLEREAASRGNNLFVVGVK